VIGDIVLGFIIANILKNKKPYSQSFLLFPDPYRTFPEPVFRRFKGALCLKSLCGRIFHFIPEHLAC